MSQTGTQKNEFDTLTNKSSDNTVELLKKLISQIRLNKPKQIENLRNQITECVRSKNLIKLIRNFLEISLIPKAKQTYDCSLVKSNSSLARDELNKLRNNFNLSIELEQLFQVTLGSQEGAFENVRLTYTGDHGQTIRQLIQTHSLRRVSMCLISSKKRKHLIVTHEKGKSSHLTILQLNALLKQDSNKRNKLTLTKLNTIPVPFTIISVVSNQSNENYISLTGLKDCYVMYLNENGQTKNETLSAQSAGTTTQPTLTNQANTQGNQQNDSSKQNTASPSSTNSGLIILHPSLEVSNYIIKSIWLPGSKAELALITSEFVKIYDLSVDKISPMYYFVLPMGKIKDVTFVYDLANEDLNLNSDVSSNEIPVIKQMKFIVIITSDGYLYYEELSNITSAKNGVYYVTNTIEQKNSQESCQQQLGAGVSVYYSFKLKLIFWSHQQGKTFIGALSKIGKNQLSLDKVFQLNLSNNKNGTASNNNSQALCNWSEIPSHPGLIMAMTLITNNPVIFMFLPDKIFYQEIKLVNNNGAPSKAKIQDMVAIRHPSSSLSSENQNDSEIASDLQDSLDNLIGLNSKHKEKTTMILLCDDGSLKIYVADSEKTEYWLQPYLRPTHPILQSKSISSWSSASLYQLCPMVIKEVSQQLERDSKERLKTIDSNHTKPSEQNTQFSANVDNLKTTNNKIKRSNTIKMKNNYKKVSGTQSSLQPNLFPIDYFEKCTELKDVEYSGSDLLEIYNSQQLKLRLQYSNSQKFILSKKSQGFRLEIINTSESNRMLLMGCRIMCGSNSLEKSPTYFEVMNRKIPVKLSRARWFDICLSKEEAFIADNKLSIFIGPSSDSANNITIIDAVICYGKIKTELGWTKTEAAELQKKYQEKQNCKLNKEEKGSESNETKKPEKKSLELMSNSSLKLFKNLEPRPFDQLLSESLDVFENCMQILNEKDQDSYKISLEFISLICHPLVLYKSKSFLFNFFKSNQPQSYNPYKDAALLNLISETFNEQSNANLDSEILEKCLLICKSLIHEKREINLVKFLNEKFCSRKKHFLFTLNELFWNIVNRSKLNEQFLNQIGDPGISNLNYIIESLVEVEHAFLLVELSQTSQIGQFSNSLLVNLIVDSYLRLLLSNYREINFTARKAILQLLKSTPKKSSSASTIVVKLKSVNQTETKSEEQKPTETESQASKVVNLEEEEELNESELPTLYSDAQTDDEMLQLAKALSLDEQQANQASAQSLSLPPAIQPRTLLPKAKTRKTSKQEIGALELQTKQPEIQLNTNSNLTKLRKILLEKFCNKITNILKLNSNLDGLKSIGFFQFILNLMSDLNPKEEHDKNILEKLIQSLLDLLKPFDEPNSQIHQRTPQNEIKLIALRTLSILLSKSKYQRSGTDTCNFIIQTLIQNLLKYNLIQKCLDLLIFVYGDHWSKKCVESNGNIFQTNSYLSLIKISDEQKYYEELSPYFVKTDPLNKDSFVVPPPNLALQNEQPSQSSSSPVSTTSSNQTNLMDNYIELFTEILIRLPYQMKKLCLGSSNQSTSDVSVQISMQFDFSAWTHYLCEYLLLPQCSFLKRLIKKLLQILCGSKEKYRKFKDQHILSTALNNLVQVCFLPSSPSAQSMLRMGTTMSEALESLSVINLPIQSLQSVTKISKISYLNLNKLVDNFKLILEVASSRSTNWQRFCIQNPTTVTYLVDLALLMGVDSNGSGTDSSNLNSSNTTSLACTSVMVPTILQLLLNLFGVTKNSTQSLQSSKNMPTSQGQSKSNDNKSNKNGQNAPANEENLSFILVNTFFKYVNRDTILKFIRSFLLEAFTPSIRWSMHSLIYNLFKNSSFQNQDNLYEILISLWNEAMTIYGPKAAQYIDILGYIILKSVGQLNENKRLKDFLAKLIDLYKQQNSVLISHPNSLIYETINSYCPELEGFYLEPEPCFICNNIEAPVQNLKLNSIKVDSRFTTSQQIFKLSTTHSIQKILIKITDIRKTKMIQTLNIYFTNRTSQSIVDLKMNMKLWSKAKQISVEPGQSEIKIEFPLPIICSNLMFEYSDFYDRDTQTSSESAILQCPRCSASVPAHPGVCTTCGENVFQCHKCRAINYDERDPFLCNSCGFCKFAKFDITLVARHYSSVDPIESEEDRKQTLQTINSLLDRVDKIYTFLSQEVKPILEALIIKLNEQSVLERFTLTTSSNPPPSTIGQTTAGIVSNPSGIIGIRMTPLTVISGLANQGVTLGNLPVGPSKQGALSIQKTIQSISQKYTESKAKFDELAKIVLKLNLCRKELREYDKQFKTVTVDNAVSRKNSIIYLEHSRSTSARSTCYGCASASIENCLTLFRILLCSNNNQLINMVKLELCRNDIIEDIINFNLKRKMTNLQIMFSSNSNITTTNSATSSNTTAPIVNNATPQTTTSILPPTTSAQTTVANNPTAMNSTGSTLATNKKIFDRDLISLVYLLLKDSTEGSERFQKMVLNKVEQFLEQSSLGTSSFLVKNEMILLSSLIQKLDDSCWEMRFRLVIHILLRSLNASIPKTSKYVNISTPKVIEELTLPMLRILNHLSKTSTSLSMINNQLNQKRPPTSGLSNFNIGINRFLSEPADVGQTTSQSNQALTNLPRFCKIDPNQFFSSKSNESYYDKWNLVSKLESCAEEKSKQIELKTKYFLVWRKYTLKKKKSPSSSTSKTSLPLSTTYSGSISLISIYDYNFKSCWLKSCLFCTSNRAVRQLTASLIQNLFQFYSNFSDNENVRKFLIVDLIAENFNELLNNSESHAEYLNLLKLIINEKESKYRLVIKHAILNKLDSFLQREIKTLSDLERLTESNIHLANSNLNLNQGLSIKSLTDLLSIFLKETNIRNKFKSRLIATVLNSYLSLKKLLYLRTKMIDDAQEKLLSVLELLTSGTEQESRKFTSICIDTVNNFDLDDLVTPVFIFERLCNIIYPEEVVDNKEFLMILEKDPNQEDYLQGRMLGNPYSSNEPGLGPLMRNVKNKICTDSELIALLEDDNGMELLVHNKIISLDLNVKDVFKKVWLAECLSEHEPMRIVYRMTGLSGDATEDIIDNLEPKNADLTKNEEEIYRMADELAHNGALKVMLERLGSINQQNFSFGKPLLRVLLKLFEYSIKLKINRKFLIKPEVKTISTMLQTLNMMLKIEVEVSLAEKLINIMQIILAEASKESEEIYNKFSALCGDREQLEFLLNNIKSKYVRSYPNLLQALMGLIPFLSFGDETKMKSLIEYFSTYVSNFDEIDKNTTTNEDILHLECFCVIVNEIEIGENGKRLRDMMHSSGILQKSIEYLLKHSPKITTYLNSDYELWKDFISRNSLPYVLRILTGLCRAHEIIQDAIGESCIPLLHKLEQFSSGNLVGVLSEDLLVALKQNPSSKVAAAIEEVRNQTKNEKKTRNGDA